jgi:hypothetical protein
MKIGALLLQLHSLFASEGGGRVLLTGYVRGNLGCRFVHSAFIEQ